MIDYREISLEELANRILEIDVSEHGTIVYYWIENKLKAIPEEWNRPKWTQDTWHRESWIVVIKVEGVKAWGAFENDCLIGMVVYRPFLTDTMAQLAALFVGKDFRRKGVATQLMKKANEQALQDERKKLYVSATPSESAVVFYQKQGFIPTQEVNEELYKLEPEDIHMVKEL
jgi:GNAT superfamily N-acetyltransferase